MRPTNNPPPLAATFSETSSPQATDAGFAEDAKAMSAGQACLTEKLDGQPAESRRIERVALIYNPHSNFWLGYAGQLQVESYLEQLFEPLGLDYTLIAFSPDRLEAIAEELSAADLDAVWVAGGDGTVLAFAPLAQRLNLPLGVIPAGTMNLLARDLGMALDLQTAMRQLQQAQVHAIDVAEVNGHPFLCISNLGLTTRYTRLREEMRHESGWIRWPKLAGQMFSALFNFPNQRMIIEAEGQAWQVKTRAISIANNRLCDRGGFLPCRDTLDAGELAIYVTKETSIWSMPRLMMKLMLGNWQHDPEMLVIHAAEAVLRIPRRRRIGVMSDGEMLELRTPLRYKMRARSLKMLRPQRQAEATEQAPAVSEPIKEEKA